MHDVICGCFCRRQVVPVMDANFSKHALVFIIFFYFLFHLLFLLFKGSQKSLPWRGNQMVEMSYY
jgi:hypothetical protein